MRIFLNNYSNTEYEEISMNDMVSMLDSCTNKEDVKFFIKHSSDDMSNIELPYNLGRTLISLLRLDTLGIINMYPDTPEAYDYGYEIYIEF